MTRRERIVLDAAQAGTPFPRIHEGRYEVDPEATGLTTPVTPGLVDAVRRAGVRLLRVGVGCWLPSQDPDPAVLHEREWFTGTSMADVDDPSKYCFTHLDRVLDVCLELGCDVLLSVDAMPATLARPGPPEPIPEWMLPFVPEGYGFPDGVRNAPPADPKLFAAVAVRLLQHVVDRGVGVRYVELWNEPDLPFFYAGTFDEWWAMYAAFARAVHDAGFKVGGPSWAGALAPEHWLDGFLDRCVAEGVPLDFYSFHRYDEVVSKVIDRCVDVRRAIDSRGLQHVEAVIDEWGYDLRQAPYFGTVGNAAFTSSCLMQFPHIRIDAQTHILLVDPVPDVALGRFHGITTKAGDPNPIYFALEAFERFQATPLRLTTAADDVVLAGVDDTGARVTVLVANPGPDTLELSLASERTYAGTARSLTKATFDNEGGWGAIHPVTLGPDPVELILEPETMLEVSAELLQP